MAVTFTQRGSTLNISAVNVGQLVREIKVASAVNAVVGPGDGTVTRNGRLVITDNATSGIDIDLFEVDNSESPNSEHIEDFVAQAWSAGEITEITTAISNHSAIAFDSNTTPVIFSGSADPAVTLDADQGVEVHDLYFNTTSFVLFINENNAVGAADWKEVGGGDSHLFDFEPNDARHPSSDPAVNEGFGSHAVISFEDATDKNIVFKGTMTNDYLENGLTLDFLWVGASVSGNVKWDASFERLNPGGNNIGSDNFGTAETVTTVVGVASGVPIRTSIVFTQGEAESIEAGDDFRILLTRDISVGSNMSGKAQLLGIAGRQ